MANRHLDSVDHDDLTSFKLRWIVTGSSITRESSTGRGNRPCIRMRDDSVANLPLTAHATYHIGFAFIPESVSNTRQIAAVTDGSGNVHLWLAYNSTGRILVQNASFTTLWTGATALLPNSENYIEWSSYIHASSGTTAVYLNGSSTPDATVYTGNTKGAGTATIGSFAFAGQGAGIYWRWHDFYANDGSGSAPDNTRWGDTVVLDDEPDADGTYTGLTVYPSGTAAAALADGTGHDGDTTRVYGTSGATTVTFPALSVTALNIRGAEIEMISRRTDGTSRTLACRSISGVTETDSATVNPGTAYQSDRFRFPVDPDTSAAWVQADLEAAEFGPVIA